MSSSYSIPFEVAKRFASALINTSLVTSTVSLLLAYRH